ncbi:MAG TPA: YihY/virulence factor BrkB family protein [Nakamurella sp.]
MRSPSGPRDSWASFGGTDGPASLVPETEDEWARRAYAVGDPLGARALGAGGPVVGDEQREFTPDLHGDGPRLDGHADLPAAGGSRPAHPRTGPTFLDDNATYPWPRPGTGPLPAIAGPVPHRWRKIVGRTLGKAWGDSLFGMSSQAAFWSALSTAPLLLALLGMVGFVSQWFGPENLTAVENQVLDFLHGIFSAEVVNDLLKDNVNNLLHNGRADLVSVGFFISLWAGSSAISAFVEAITIAYGQHEVRNPVIERLFALGLYLVALVSGVVLLPVLALGPAVLAGLFPNSIRDEAGSIISVAYYPVIVVALVVLLATFYKVAPKHKHPWHRGVPGAVLATLVFVVASFGLRLYIAYVYSHGLTYGALATPIKFLLFYYMMALAVIIGAQFNNATLEYYPPRVSRRERKKWPRYDPALDERAGRAGK